MSRSEKEFDMQMRMLRLFAQRSTFYESWFLLALAGGTTVVFLIKAIASKNIAIEAILCVLTSWLFGISLFLGTTSFFARVILRVATRETAPEAPDPSEQ